MAAAPGTVSRMGRWRAFPAFSPTFLSVALLSRPLFPPVSALRLFSPPFSTRAMFNAFSFIRRLSPLCLRRCSNV
jgi:hypothetical protein